MDAYFDRELVIAIIIPLVIFTSFLLIDAWQGGTSPIAFIALGLFIIIILLGVGLISSRISLVLSIIYHSYYVIIACYDGYRLFKMRNLDKKK